MSIIIADSGSTKTDWIVTDSEGATSVRFASSGINPCLVDNTVIARILLQEVSPHIPHRPSQLFFYGAGCRPDQLERMASLLTTHLRVDTAVVQSDLVGAAHALCGHSPGIVAILGTGSGSAVYDGQRFTAQTPSLGYILGDEGSGAVLGRRLLGDIFKGQLPESTLRAFHEAYPELTLSKVIESVYRGETPNRFLAQFTFFLAHHRDDDCIHSLLIDEFCRFFHRNILPYGCSDLATHCVGSVADVFETELREAAVLTGVTVGTILRSPIDRLANFCAREQCQPSAE